MKKILIIVIWLLSMCCAFLQEVGLINLPKISTLCKISRL